MDAFAVWTVRLHLGRKRSQDPKHPYAAFVANTQHLLASCALTATAAELDSYLWIRGAYEAWRRDPTKMNVELKALFADRARKRDIATVIGKE